MKHEPVDLAAGRLGAVWSGGAEEDPSGSRRSDTYGFSRLGITRRPQSPSPASEPAEPPSSAPVARRDPVRADGEKAAPPAPPVASTTGRRRPAIIDLLGMLTGKSDASPKTKRLVRFGGAVLAGSVLLTLLSLFWPSRQVDHRPLAATVQAAVAQPARVKPPAPAKIDSAEPSQDQRGDLPPSIAAAVHSQPVRSLAPTEKALWAWLGNLVPERRAAPPSDPPLAFAKPARATDVVAAASAVVASAKVVRPPAPAAADPEVAPDLSGQEVTPPISPDSNAWLPMPQILLTGTVHGLGPKPIAMINGRLVKLGQSYKGARIVQVGDAWIQVEFQGRRRRIGLAVSGRSESTTQKQ